jgi:hypothetical protein
MEGTTVLFQHSTMCKRCLQHDECRIKCFELLVLTWSPRLPFKLGEPGSILGWTSTQGLKIIEEKELPLLDFRVFSDKDVVS